MSINPVNSYADYPWEHLGTSLVGLPVTQIYEASGLDWEVSREAVPGASLDPSGNPRKFEVKRKARNANEVDIPLHIAGPTYRVLQNKRLFDFFEKLEEVMQSVNAPQYEKAGYFQDGETVWVSAKLPGQVTLPDGRILEKYVLFHNSHDGSASATVTLMLISRDTHTSFALSAARSIFSLRLRHSPAMDEKLNKSVYIVLNSQKTFDDVEELFTQFSRITLTEERVMELLQLMIPSVNPPQHFLDERIPISWRYIIDRLPGDITLWSFYEAFSTQVDFGFYRPNLNPDRRLQRVWFGQAAALKRHALAILENELANIVLTT